MLTESVVKLLKNEMWDLATCSEGEPNVVPVAFKDVTEDGKLVVGDVFLETTLANIKADGGKIAVSVYDAKNRQWSGIFYKEDSENEMTQCQKCDHRG